MNNIHVQLLLLEELYSKVNFTWDAARRLVSGNRAISTREKEILIELEDNCQFTDIEIERSHGANLVSDIRIDESVIIRIALVRHNGIFFGENLDDLLTSNQGKYCTEIPRHGCLLLDEDWKSWRTDESKQSINAYKKIVGFIDFLKSDIANHEDASNIYLFGSEERLKIPTTYQAKVIENNSGEILDSLATINSLMSGESHKKEKAHQLKAILLDVLKASSEVARLDFMIQELANIEKRFVHNYELFVSGFSFDDSKETLRKENREYTSELNNVINSIHSRILGIPLGTVLPAFLIKAIKADATQTGRLDILIFLSALFMCLVIAFSLIGQYRVLKKVRKEYGQKWQRMKTEIPKLENDLRDEFNDLEWSFWLNKCLIILFGLALILFFIIPLEAYYEVEIFASTIDFFKSLGGLIGSDSN